MTQQVSTLMPVRSLADLKYEWGIMAFRPNGHGEWRWYLQPDEIRTYTTMVSEGFVVSAHRRDGDGTRIVAKLKGKSK